MNKPITDDSIIKIPPTSFFLTKMPIIAEIPISPKTYLVSMHNGQACKYKNLSITTANKIIKIAEIAIAHSK